MSQAHAVHAASSFDTDIVVDLGCCGYVRNGRMEDSIHTLVKRFKPKILFGFDPHPAKHGHHFFAGPPFSWKTWCRRCGMRKEEHDRRT